MAPPKKTKKKTKKLVAEVVESPPVIPEVVDEAPQKRVKAEVVEAEVSETSSIVNSTIEELNLPHEVIVGGVIRDGTFIMPEPSFTIRAGDDVIILASRAKAQDVEKMFSVQVDIF